MERETVAALAYWDRTVYSHYITESFKTIHNGAEEIAQSIYLLYKYPHVVHVRIPQVKIFQYPRENQM